MTATGPLKGIRVLEFEAIGPCPFAGMMLSDLGAEVVTIARPGKTKRSAASFEWRGRRIVEADLKDPTDNKAVRALMAETDILIEGFRPGVMERLGLGPETALALNRRLVYGRMTGWGQDGPLSRVAGHDITYIAITGALDAFRPAHGPPVPPLNLVGDYGGGAMYLLVGVLAALTEACRSGQGQVVDAAMCDGVSLMLTMFRSLMSQGSWQDAPRSNFLDGGAPYYNVYECLDGRHLAVGAIEPQFYARLRHLAGLDGPLFDEQDDAGRWPEQQARMREIFRTRTRDDWAGLLEGDEACVAPVLSMTEATKHPHLVARGTFTTCDGQTQPAPAPRFSRTPAGIQGSPARIPVSIADVLANWKK